MMFFSNLVVWCKEIGKGEELGTYIDPTNS